MKEQERLQQEVTQAANKSVVLQAELESVNKEWAPVKEELQKGNPPLRERATKLDEQVKQLEDEVTATKATVDGLKSDYETYTKQYLPDSNKP